MIILPNLCKYVLQLDKFLNLKSAGSKFFSEIMITRNLVGNVKSTVKFVMYRL